MAVDVQQVAATEPTAPEGQQSTPAQESPRSGGLKGFIAKRFLGDPATGTSSGTTERASTVETPDAEVATPPREERPAPRHVFQTDEELRRHEQSVSDAAIERYRKKSEEDSRKQTIDRYQQRIKEARSMNDLALAGELAGELQDYQEGVSSQTNSEESIRSAQERASLEAQRQTATQLDTAYTAAFWESLSAPMQEQYAEWWNKTLQPDAQGRIQHSPEEARGLIVKQFMKLHADYHRQLGRDDVIDEIDSDPDMKKVVMAKIHAPANEPPTVRGTAQGGSPQYRTVQEVKIAVGTDEITAAEGAALIRRLEGRRR